MDYNISYEEKSGSWKIKYSNSFDKSIYDYVLDRFKDSGFEPQTFAKDRAYYQDLYIFVSAISSKLAFRRHYCLLSAVSMLKLVYIKQASLKQIKYC